MDFSYFPYHVADPGRLAIEAVEAMHPDYEYWRVAREMDKLGLEDEVSLAAALGLDAFALARSGFAFELSELLSTGLGAVSAGLGARLAVWLIDSRIRSHAGDLTGFCYYNWGQALLCLALFLLV